MRKDSALNQLHKISRGRFAQFYGEVERMGWVPSFNSVYRSFADQAALKAAKPTLAAKPGFSAHNYGMAVDSNFQKAGMVLGSKTSKAEWESSGIPAVARRLGIRWGGNFSSTDYDPIHFDTWASAADGQRYYNLAIAQFGKDVTKIIGNEIHV